MSERGGVSVVGRPAARRHAGTTRPRPRVKAVIGVPLGVLLGVLPTVVGSTHALAADGSTSTTAGDAIVEPLGSVFPRGTSLPPTVFADGTGLPPGEGTAREGAVLYAARCAGCHGAAGEGASAVELVGDPASIAGGYPDRGIALHWPYAPPLHDYVRRAMPPDAPWSLSAAEGYAVVARVLELNGLVDADTVVDAGFLAELVMPNANGFESAPD